MKLIELYIKNSLLLSKTNDEILLDFRNCDRILNVIIGEMGSGKTALMGLMHPFATYGTLDKRNEASIFIPEKDGIKRTIFKHEGNYYTCEHVGKWTKDHHSIKSYFAINDEEMNPNGNQASFKDLVKLHLGIDQSYLALLRLGSNVENLIDKTASERKAYISDKVKDTEFYAIMFKALKDEYKTYKAQSSVILNKLQSLSSDKYDDFREALIISNSDLATLQKQKETLMQNMYSMNAEVDKLLNGLDFTNATNQLYQYKEDLIRLDNEIIGLENRILEIESNHTAEEIMQILADSRAKLTVNKEEIRKLDESHTKNVDILSKLEENLKICKNDTSLNAMKEAYRELNEQLIMHEKDIEGFDIEESSISLKSYVDIIDTINQLIVDISEYDSSLIAKIYGSDSSILSYAKKQCEILNYKKIKLLNQMSSIRFSEKYEAPYTLYQPPFCPCKKGDCPYVETHPYTIQKKNKNKSIIDEKLNELQEELKGVENAIFRYAEYPTIYTLCTQFKKQWAMITKKLKSLDLLLIGNGLQVITNPVNRKWFDYDGLIKMISLAEKRERYYKIMERYEKVKAEINSLTKYDEESLVKEIEHYETQIQNELTQILTLEEENRQIMDKMDEYDKLYIDLSNIEAYKIQKEDLKRDKEVLQGMIDKLSDGLAESRILQEKLIIIGDKMQENDSRIKEVTDRIVQLNYVIKDIEYNKEELDSVLYKLKYYELMIRASSSKEGIPLEYIKIFLAKTKDKINRLISGVFEDDIEILDFMISETDFKIPYMINGQVVDDISSLSQGQTSIITLALSFALVDNMESPYNIFLLDEVDGALYEANRRKFLNILLNQIKEVGIEQIFLITHNGTFEGTPINVIMTTNEPVSEDKLTTVMKVF